VKGEGGGAVIKVLDRAGATGAAVYDEAENSLKKGGPPGVKVKSEAEEQLERAYAVYRNMRGSP
jgi:hypothetical protein